MEWEGWRQVWQQLGRGRPAGRFNAEHNVEHSHSIDVPNDNPTSCLKTGHGGVNWSDLPHAYEIA